MKKITLSLIFVLFSFIGLAQTVTIGSGTNVGLKLPVVPYYVYSYSQQIVLQSEIVTTGSITKLRFYSTGSALTTNSNNWTIYLGHTSKTAFTTNSDWILSSAMTQVYSGLVSASPGPGWMEITLTNPFVYNNIDNLVVAIDENAANYTSGSTTNYFRIWTTPVSNRGIYYQSDTTNPDPSNITLTGTRTSYLAQMQFDFGAPPSCLPPVSPTLSSFATTTATFNWSAPTSEPANGYEWEVRSSGLGGSGASGLVDSGTTGAGILTASSSLLTPNATYTVFVRSNCGGSDFSVWSSSSTFTTLKTEPTNQITALTAGSFSASSIPLTWTSADTGSQLPDGYLVKASSVNLVSILDPIDGTDPSNVTAFTANAANKKQTSGTATSTTSFTGMVPGTMYYYKVYSYTNTGSNINFKTDNPATLSHATKPNSISSTLTNVNLNTNSIGFDFSSTSYLSGSNEYIIFAKEGSAITAGTPVLSPATYTSNSAFGIGTVYEGDANAFCVYKGDANSINITGLNPATTYYFLMYAVVESPNSNGSYSFSTGTNVNRTTVCLATTIPTVLETFESANSGIPVCWANGAVSGSENWDIANGSSGDISSAYAGTNFMEKNYTSSDAFLISQALDYSSITTPTRINTYLHRHASAHANDQYKIYINTSPSLTGATQIYSLYSRTNTVPIVASTGWYNYVIDIPSSFNGESTVYVIFEGITTAGFNSYDLGIDDFMIEFSPTDTPDYVNLQWPPSATILAGEATTVYGQVYEAGLTDITSDQAAGINVWVGISPVGLNTNPNTWTTWIPAIWNAASGINNNDEYQANIGSSLMPGTYYYATRFQLNGGPYRYGGIDSSNNGNFWDGTTYNSGVLTVNANPTQCANLVSPANNAINISTGTVALNWTAPLSGPTPTGYKVYYGTTPNPTSLITTTNGTTFTYNVTASGIATTYYWRIVPTSVVGGGDATSCSEFSFTTANPAAPYCMPTYSSGGTTDDITNVTLGVLNNTTSGNVAPYYTFFNALPIPDLLTGSTVNVSVTFGTHSTQWSAIWIDFNQNDIFEASEGFLASSNPGANGTTVYSIPIPSNAVLGNTRMRVRGGDDSQLTTTQACGVSNSSWGETEDYIVNITSLCATTATWDGTTWTGTPSSTAALVFNGDYTHTSATTLDGCSCTINGTSVVTFNEGTLNIQNQLSSTNGTSIIFESGANLVQVNTTFPNDVLGNFVVKRNSANMVRLDYTGWASPVVGQNALAFSPATLTNRFYEYDPTANTYFSINPSITNFTAGKGLLVRAPNTWPSSTPTAYQGIFTGVPNNGNITSSVSAGFNLIGNPYASPISASSFLDNLNNDGLGMTTLYFWTHTLAANTTTGNYAQSNYATHNGTGGVAADAGGATPDGIIQVGQGFIVNVAIPGNAEFNNTMRLATSNGQFFKTNGQLNQPLTVERHRMWLGLTSPGNDFNQILVGYVQGATNGFDASYDAKLFEQTNSVLYSPINNLKYVIQGRSLPFVTSDVVPLGLLAQTAGQYTIAMDNFDGLFLGQDIYLRDNLLNVTHDIKGSSYTFVSDAGQFDSRFEIVYAAPLAVETPLFDDNSVIVYSNEYGININAGQTIIDSVKVFDVRGRLLYSKSKIDATSINLENVASEKQVLIVQITSIDNITISKKIIN